MNCQEAQTQLLEYLESSLDALRMKSIETHLLSCPVCRASRWISGLYSRDRFDCRSSIHRWALPSG